MHSNVLRKVHALGAYGRRSYLCLTLEALDIVGWTTVANCGADTIAVLVGQTPKSLAYNPAPSWFSAGLAGFNPLEGHCH